MQSCRYLKAVDLDELAAICSEEETNGGESFDSPQQKRDYAGYLLRRMV